MKLNPNFLIPFSALVAPLFLIPIEKLFPYPHIVEELVKACLIFFIIKIPNKTFQLKYAIFVGFLFGFSENLLYLANIIQRGTPILFWQRLFLTTPMHIFTSLIILLPTLKNKNLLPFGLAAAILIHFWFNRLILQGQSSFYLSSLLN